MIPEQYLVADRTLEFINKYGLLKQYVSQKCGINRERMSGWLHHNCSLRPEQVNTIVAFIEDYEQRMS